MKKLYTLFILFIFFNTTACSKKNETKLPLSIQSIIDSVENCTCYPRIELFEWNGAYIYWVDSVGSGDYVTFYCDGISSVVLYNVNGEEIIMDQNMREDFALNRKFIKEIWNCRP